MRIVFMGTPDFAVSALVSLKEAGHEILACVTQPDKPKGRGKAVLMTPVKEKALEYQIPVYQPARVRDESFQEILRELNPDVIVVAAFGQIIPRSILELPPYGCINIHASLLPKYRGAAPIQWALIDGEKETGITTMQMDEGLDTGDMLLKETVPLEEKETGGSLFDKLSRVGADLCVKALKELEKGTIVPEKQGESPTAYASMLTKEMGKIDWTKDAESIERLVRGLNPWPSAYTKLNGKTLKIWECKVVRQDASKGECGEILNITKDFLTVQAGKDALEVTELQLEGKKRMDAGSFLRGNSVSAGTVLGV